MIQIYCDTLVIFASLEDKLVLRQRVALGKRNKNRCVIQILPC